MRFLRTPTSGNSAATSSERMAFACGRSASSCRAPERRRGAVSRDAESHAAPSHHASQVDAGVGGIVNRVDEYATPLPLRRHLSIHVRRCGRYDEPRAVEIRWLERLTLDRHAGGLDVRAHVGCNDNDVGPGRAQGRDLGRRDRTAADNHDATALELQKRGKERDGDLLSPNQGPQRRAPKNKKPGSFSPPGLRCVSLR
jgi:hypothetical protein